MWFSVIWALSLCGNGADINDFFLFTNVALRHKF